MKVLTFGLLILLPTLVLSWPIKEDNLEQLEAEGAKFVDEGKQQFLDAVNREGAQLEELAPFFKEFLNYINRAKENDDKLVSNLQSAAKRMIDIAKEPITRTTMKRLHALTTILRNRNHVSTGILFFATNWVEARFRPAKEKEGFDNMMNLVFRMVSDARDAMQVLESTIEQRVDYLRAATANGIDEDAKAAVKDAIGLFVEMDKTIFDDVEDIIAVVEDLARVE